MRNLRNLFSLRRGEEPFKHSRWICETWNTWSNLAFILIGLARLWEGTPDVTLYVLFIGLGIASGIHHAVQWKYSILIDYVPIILSLLYALHNNMLLSISLGTGVKLVIALLVLFADHSTHLIPVPWGHVMWHLLAAFSLDTAYQEHISR